MWNTCWGNMCTVSRPPTRMERVWPLPSWEQWWRMIFRCADRWWDKWTRERLWWRHWKQWWRTLPWKNDTSSRLTSWPWWIHLRPATRQDLGKKLQDPEALQVGSQEDGITRLEGGSNMENQEEREVEKQRESDPGSYMIGLLMVVRFAGVGTHTPRDADSTVAGCMCVSGASKSIHSIAVPRWRRIQLGRRRQTTKLLPSLLSRKSVGARRYWECSMCSVGHRGRLPLQQFCKA